MQASDLFDFPESLPFSAFFAADAQPWDWVKQIKEALRGFEFSEQMLELPSGLQVTGDVFIHPSVVLPPFGSIEGPAYIGADCELRAGVYIRGNVIAGAGSVLGNSCEFKNCLLLEGVQVPHFSYVGDSVLGNRAHLGAGVICSNLRLDQSEVAVQMEDGRSVCSGLRKLGALLGDDAEVGCNAVLNPGVVLGKRALVMPTIAFRGTLGPGSIAYEKSKVERLPRTD